MFEQIFFPKNFFSFELLCEGIEFEDLCPGRNGAILMTNNNTRRRPIVRSTTKYEKPPQYMSKEQKEYFKLLSYIPYGDPHDWINKGNALVEIYDERYKTMGYHSDQAQDLEKDGYILLFSCYKNPETKNLRTLQIKNKSSGSEKKILLKHNSFVAWKVFPTNGEHLHKIILEKHDCSYDSTWLGVTFRLSTCPEDVSHVASDQERKEFYMHRRNENKFNGYYEYPHMTYTLSPSDLMEPVDVVVGASLAENSAEDLS